MKRKNGEWRKKGWCRKLELRGKEEKNGRRTHVATEEEIGKGREGCRAGERERKGTKR